MKDPRGSDPHRASFSKPMPGKRGADPTTVSWRGHEKSYVSSDAVQGSSSFIASEKVSPRAAKRNSIPSNLADTYWVNLWEAVRNRLRTGLGGFVFHALIEPLSLLRLSDETLYLEACDYSPDYEWLNTNYAHLIAQAFFAEGLRISIEIVREYADDKGVDEAPHSFEEAQSDRHLADFLPLSTLAPDSRAIETLVHRWGRDQKDDVEGYRKRVVQRAVDHPYTDDKPIDVSKLESAISNLASALNVSEETVELSLIETGLYDPHLEKWFDRNRNKMESPVQFVTRVFSRWLGRGLDSEIIRKIDFPLYRALAQHKKRHGLEIDLPTRRNKLTDGELRKMGIKKPSDAFANLPPEKRRDADSLDAAARLYHAARRRDERPPQRRAPKSKLEI